MVNIKYRTAIKFDQTSINGSFRTRANINYIVTNSLERCYMEKMHTDEGRKLLGAVEQAFMEINTYRANSLKDRIHQRLQDLDVLNYYTAKGEKITKPVQRILSDLKFSKKAYANYWPKMCKEISELYYPSFQADVYFEDKARVFLDAKHGDNDSCFRKGGCNSHNGEFVRANQRIQMLVLSRQNAPGTGRCLVYFAGGRRVFLFNFYSSANFPHNNREMFKRAVTKVLGQNEIISVNYDNAPPVPIYQNDDHMEIVFPKEYDFNNRAKLKCACGAWEKAVDFEVYNDEDSTKIYGGHNFDCAEKQANGELELPECRGGNMVEIDTENNRFERHIAGTPEPDNFLAINIPDATTIRDYREHLISLFASQPQYTRDAMRIRTSPPFGVFSPDQQAHDLDDEIDNEGDHVGDLLRFSQMRADSLDQFRIAQPINDSSTSIRIPPDPEDVPVGYRGDPVFNSIVPHSNALPSRPGSVQAVYVDGRRYEVGSDIMIRGQSGDNSPALQGENVRIIFRDENGFEYARHPENPVGELEQL